MSLVFFFATQRDRAVGCGQPAAWRQSAVRRRTAAHLHLIGLLTIRAAAKRLLKQRTLLQKNQTRRQMIGIQFLSSIALLSLVTMSAAQIVDCVPNPCVNFGVCNNATGTPVCDCTGTYYEGPLCATMQANAQTNPRVRLDLSSRVVASAFARQ